MVVRGVYYNPFQGSQGPQEGSKAKILTFWPKNSKWLKMAQTHLKMAQTHLKLKMAQTHLKLISKIQNGSKWLKLISKFWLFDPKIQNGSNSSQIIQWSSGGYITIHFRGLRGLRRAQKPKFWLFDPKIQNGRFRPFSFSKVQKPYQWSQLG